MFLQRALVAAILLPIGLVALFGGEVPFAILMIIVCEIAVWEYSRLFRIGGYELADVFIYLGVFSIFLANLIFGLPIGLFCFIIFSLMASGWHLWRYEHGRESALFDMMVSLTGLFLIGFLGGYFIILRDIPGGDWWLLVVLSSVWWADVGGYIVGSLIGKNLIAPRISPKKTWEGYIGGAIISLLGSPFLLFVYRSFNLPLSESITYFSVVLLALMLGTLSILGDLIISLIKRYFGEKDTGKLLPGHGGILDRIDSWLWAVALGYYLITAIILS